MDMPDSKPVIDYSHSFTPDPLGSKGRWRRALVIIALALAIFGGTVMVWTCVLSLGDRELQGGEKVGLWIHQGLGGLILILQGTVLLPVVFIFGRSMARQGQKPLARMYCIGAAVCFVMSLAIYAAGCLPYPNGWRLMFWMW